MKQLLPIAALAATSLLPAQARWVQTTPATSPTARAGTVGQSDGTGVLMFGGNLGSNVFSDELWRFDGVTWTDVTPAGTKPSPRDFYAAAYDSARGRLVLFGGRSSAGVEGDTWEWDGTSWTQRTPATSPSPRRWSAMGYDAPNNRCILFGGETANASTYVNDTWAWDGNDWTQLAPATSPSARGRGAMSHDPSRGELLHFGGRNAAGALRETWVWNGANWRQVTTATVPYTNGCFAYGVTYDPIRDRHVMFGGTTTGPTLAGTWEFDGTSWASRTTAPTPASRTGPCMAFLQSLGETVLFGGFQTAMLSDTWRYQTDVVGSFRVHTASPGCPDSNGRTATLDIRNVPWVDDVFSVDITNVAPGNAIATAIDFSGPVSIDLTAYGAPGCRLYTGMPLVFPSGAGPVGNLAVPVPLDPVLKGWPFQVQAIVFDGAANTLGLVFSSRGDAVIGIR